MDLLSYVVVALGVVAAAGLTILGLRGRFGTPRQQGAFELSELARSEAPRSAIRREAATCRGHSLEGRPLLGSGVLYLTEDRLGFILRDPRRTIEIATSDIRSVTASSSYHRPGMSDVSDAEDFLVIEWSAPKGPATIAFRLPEPKRWVDDIEAVAG